MEADLTRQLRSPLADERRAAAKRLGALGTEAAVAALIAMANSGPLLDDQLLAIECLGDTGSPRALSFIQALCCEAVVEVPTTYTWSSGEEIHEESCLDEQHFCPHAQGPLRFALTYIVQLCEAAPRGEGVRKRSDDDIAADRESIPRSREAFRVVHDALAKLT